MYAVAIWGSTFFVVKQSFPGIEPVTQVAFRFLLVAFLVGLSLRINMVVMALAVVVFVYWTITDIHQTAKQWVRTLVIGLASALAGLAIFLLVTLALVWNNPTANYVHVTLFPSRSAWDLDANDLDTPLEQLSGIQLDKIVSAPCFVHLP